MNASKQNVEDITLTFSGLNADKGIIDVIDLTRALQGWCDYWEVTGSSFFIKELSTKPLPIHLRPTIRIRALEKATFDVIGQVIIPLGLMVSYDILKSLWKWRKLFLKQHINNKKKFVSKEEAVENIKSLAQRYDIKSRNTTDVVRLIDLADEALNSLVEPIDNSAKTIIIKSTASRESLSLTSSDKRALRSGYHLEPGIASQGLEKFSIKFLRIHTETGNAIITFNKPCEINQMGHEFSTIIDPTVKKPKNIYTRALYEGTTIEVWGRKVFKKTNNEFLRWEIPKNLPLDNNPLFDKKTKGDGEKTVVQN